MNRNRKGYFVGRSGWTRSELRLGRMLRNPEGEHGGEGGGGDSGAAGNNADGNNDPGAQSQGTQNNGGQDFDYSRFWDAQQDGNGGDGNNGDGQTDDSQVGSQLGQRLLQQIEGFRGDDVFTTEALEAMRSGDLNGLNQSINKAQQGTMKQILGMTAMMLQAFEQSLIGRMESHVQSSLRNDNTNRQDEQLLANTFASFNQPQMQPVIRGVFNRALQHSKGNRQDAIKLTRDMLQMMGQTGMQDFGITGNSNPDDNLSAGPSRLVEELLGRTG